MIIIFLLVKFLVFSFLGVESNGKFGSWIVLINLENWFYIIDLMVMIDVFFLIFLYIVMGIVGLFLLVKFIILVILIIICNFSLN